MLESPDYFFRMLEIGRLRTTTVLQAKRVESAGFCSWWIFWTILNDNEAHDISK